MITTVVRCTLMTGVAWRRVGALGALAPFTPRHACIAATRGLQHSAQDHATPLCTACHQVLAREKGLPMKNTVTAISLACLGLTACQKSAEPQGQQPQAAAAGQAPVDKIAQGRAVVTLGAVGTSGASGKLQFFALPDEAGVKIDGELMGLSPGNHGMHVHEVGSCDSPDGMSAGGHFNPTAAPHGAADAATSHVGDLGNITADAQGHAKVSIIKGAARLTGPATIVGRSIIVHKDADDCKSQPAGQSGARIACGVIRAD